MMKKIKITEDLFLDNIPRNIHPHYNNIYFKKYILIKYLFSHFFVIIIPVFTIK